MVGTWQEPIDQVGGKVIGSFIGSPTSAFVHGCLRRRSQGARHDEEIPAGEKRAGAVECESSAVVTMEAHQRHRGRE